MIVEDNDDLAGLVALRLDGIEGPTEVRRVADGVTALEVAREFDPAVVVMDQGLPGMGGEEVATQLRQISDQIAIVSFSGLDSERPWADESVPKGADGLRRLADVVLEAVARVKRRGGACSGRAANT